MNHLFDYRMAAWAKPVERPCANEGDRSQVTEVPRAASLPEKLGKVPDFELYSRRYKPPVPHEELPDQDEECGVSRVKVEGVVVRYVEQMRSVQMTVEGELPQETLDTLSRDLLDKLSALENSPRELVQL
jgi:hypothetical protein